MSVILFVWWLFTFPTDRLICTMWTPAPTQEAIASACGTVVLAELDLEVFPLAGGQSICSRMGDEIGGIVESCQLTEPLDHYILKLIKPNEVTTVCSLTVTHPGPPTSAEISMDCPNPPPGEWRLMQTIVQEPAPHCAAPEISIGPGLYDQAASSADIATHDDLTWLAGRLYWFGELAMPACGGAAVLDASLAAAPCGMEAARPAVIEWQNKFDGEIYSAAIAARVPARLLKRIMMVESQFWPMWSERAGETGLMQITDNGLDVLLRFDPDLDGAYLARSDKGRLYARMEVLSQLRCDFCDLARTIQHTREVIPTYARILAAYRCRAVENTHLSGAEAWRQAASDYNGGGDYLSKVEDGQ